MGKYTYFIFTYTLTQAPFTKYCIKDKTKTFEIVIREIPSKYGVLWSSQVFLPAAITGREPTRNHDSRSSEDMALIPMKQTVVTMYGKYLINYLFAQFPRATWLGLYIEEAVLLKAALNVVKLLAQKQSR